jgi:hypothetical protein
MYQPRNVPGPRNPMVISASRVMLEGLGEPQLGGKRVAMSIVDTYWHRLAKDFTLFGIIFL